jgi:hypothetical protein
MRTDDNRLKAYANDVAARAYAMDHQDSAGFGALDGARHLLATDPGTPSGLVYFFNSGQLASTESTCYMNLGQPECRTSDNSSRLRSRNSPGWPVVSFYLTFVVAWGMTRPGRLLGR